MSSRTSCVSGCLASSMSMSRLSRPKSRSSTRLRHRAAHSQITRSSSRRQGRLPAQIWYPSRAVTSP
eukprot:scaffold763_cov402-Prasinococcus_capsulatus_cf.AAC.20